MMTRSLLAGLAAASAALLWLACGAQTSEIDDDDESGPASGSVTGSGGNGGAILVGGFGGGSSCGAVCSSDLHHVLDCNGNILATCTGTDGCDSSTGTCTNACAAAKNNKNSIGCDYFATDMEQFQPEACFATFIANTWNTPVQIGVSYAGSQLPVQNFARIPQGQGPSLSYLPYDSSAGLQPGEVAILFLSGGAGGQVPCPAPAAISGNVGLTGTGIGSSFRIQTDVPVVAYQINPYGGGSAAVTGASLLLPTSAWDTNYIAVNAYQQDIASPSMNIVAMEDATEITILPIAPITGGGGIPSCAANTPCTFTLGAGQNAQLTQPAELTGSVIQSTKPIGFMAGQPCMRTPFGVAYCDHGEQMVPPIQALGSEYVGVMYRPRAGEPAIWRIIGAVNGTQLSWSSDVGGPPSLDQGQVAEFTTATPFVVSSQDEDHPFLLFTYMSGSQWGMLNNSGGYGDVDFVISVPPDQYLSRYVFFADPTYPETNLVIVRRRDSKGVFHDVNLDCAGTLTGWQPVGDYEWTRTDLITGNFQNVGGCSTGRREIHSDGRFGLWVWGWGTPETSSFTANVSYGYPGGMNLQPINEVVVPPTPK